MLQQKQIEWKKKLEDRIIEFKCKTSGLAFTCIYIYIHHVRISTSEIVNRENHVDKKNRFYFPFLLSRE